MRWMHLSDIHMNKVYTNVKSILLQEELLKFLQDKEMKIDCLFLSGDFRDAEPLGDGCLENRENQAMYIAQYIKKLGQTLNLEMDQIYLVPGNHDFDRTSENKQRIEEIRTEYPKHRQSFDDSEREELLKRFAFFEQIEEYVHPNKKTGLYWAEHRFYPGKEVDILCLNTEMSCYTGDEQDKLMLDTAAIEELVKEARDSAKPIIVLAHHSLDIRVEEDKENLKCILQNRQVFYLCGHTHTCYQNYNCSAKWCDITVGSMKYAQDNDYLFAIGSIGAADALFEVEFYRYDAAGKAGWKYTGEFSFRISTFERFFEGVKRDESESIYLPLPNSSASTSAQRKEAIRTLAGIKEAFGGLQPGKTKKVLVHANRLSVNAGILIGYALHSRQQIQLEYENNGQHYKSGGQLISFEQSDQEVTGLLTDLKSVPLCVYIQAKKDDNGMAVYKQYLDENGLAQGQQLYFVNKDMYDETFDLEASAKHLASEITQCVEKLMDKSQKKVQVHLFYNGFWGLALFLGNQMPTTFSVQLHDYDAQKGSYQKSFCLKSSLFKKQPSPQK